MTCNGMSFFPTNFMLQDDHQPPISLNSKLPPCTSQQDFHGSLGKSSMSFSGIYNGDDDMSDDDGSQAGGEKKRRLNMEQVKILEKNFELGNKLEPEKKLQLARALGLQPRQIAIWFQNRRARWKTKQLEKDYDLLKKQFDAIKADNVSLKEQNQKLHAQIVALKNREPINLNKETEGSCSNRSENGSDIKLDMSTRPAIDSPISTKQATTSSIDLFPSSSIRPTTGVAQLFQNPSSSQKIDQLVKEESFTNMFSSIDDQSGFWPWLDQQHNFN